jgi:hypothetical protein
MSELLSEIMDRSLKVIVFVLSSVILTIGFVFTVGTHRIAYEINKRAAISTMKTIRSAQITFKAKHDRYGSLKDLIDDKLISKSLSLESYYGFRYKIEAEKDSYKAVATPEKFSKKFSESTGDISLFLDQTKIIRIAYLSYNEGKTASSTDDPLK